MTQPTERSDQAYADAQHAIAMLKSTIYRVLLDAGQEGLSNAQYRQEAWHIHRSQRPRGTYSVHALGSHGR